MAYTATMTAPQTNMRACAPPGAPQTMEGSASMVRTPLRVVQSKGAREERMTTGQGKGENIEWLPVPTTA
jgi:hypothetical protein